MDYRQLLTIRKNLFQAEFFRLNPTLQPKGLTSEERIQQNAGDIQIFQKGQLIATPEIPVEQPIVSNISVPSKSSQSIQESLFLALQDLFVQNASISLSPTKSARIYQLWFFSVTTGFSSVTETPIISGVKDNQDWSAKTILVSDSDRLIWFNRVLSAIMPSFIPGWSATILESKEREKYGWTTEQQTTEADRVKSAGNFTSWFSAWNTWFTYRKADGSTAAAIPPTSAQLPNGTTYLETTQTQDFTNSSLQPYPEKWTPLKISGAAKNYLTQGWGDVLSSCLSAADENEIKTEARSVFPGFDTETRTFEINALVSLTNSLTDEQKIIAEFWAGGPNTISPPGMSVYLWKQYVQNTNQTDTLIIQSGFALSIHLFEASRITWALKKEFLEARPIQEIRRLFASQTLKNQDGTDISGASWMPYQMPNFVTPPFPDFPSGHSTFSKAFANVMDTYFSESTPSQTFSTSDLNLMAPIFQAVPTSLSFRGIPIQNHTSEIQPGIVPAKDILLGWNTWSEMAESAGISRQQGGIHCISAHTGGQAVANTMFSKIQSAWF